MEFDMKRILLIAALAALASGRALAEPALSNEAGLEAYDAALKSYSCVDYDKALRLFRANADKGHALSQYMVGVMLNAGQGAAKDDKAAFDWFTRAARQDLADAHFALGDMYHKGEGVAKDDAQALFWFKLAAAAGHSLAKDMVDSIASTLQPAQLDQVSQQQREWAAKKGR
jgi:TPR repeat protein